MQVIRASEMGFCMGVRRAVQIMEAEASPELPVFSVGEIVHNPHVVSSLQRNGVIQLPGPDEIDGDIVVHGSVTLVRALIDNDLVDELRLMVFPVVLGTGKRLFGETSDKKPLRLADSSVVGDGVSILIYEPAADREG